MKAAVMPIQDSETLSAPREGVGQRGPIGEALVLVSDAQPGGLLRQRGAARGANWSRTGPIVHPE